MFELSITDGMPVRKEIHSNASYATYLTNMETAARMFNIPSGVKEIYEAAAATNNMTLEELQSALQRGEVIRY